MRVVHVANFYSPTSGGLRTTMHALGRGYRAAGHDVVLVVPGPRPDDEQTPWGRRVTLPAPRVPRTGGYRLLVDLPLVRRVLAGLRPDVLEVSDRTTLTGLGPWARSAGVPAVALVHERLDRVLAQLTSGRLPWVPVADAWNRRLATGFDRLVTTTEFAGEELARVGAGNRVTVPLGVDLETFAPTHDPDLRRHLVGDQRVLLVHCGRLSREKRPVDSVATLRVLRARGVDARLVVAGTGPLAGPLRAAARGLPVELLGHVPDPRRLARVLGAADVVVAPGPHETFGLAALEALACGTPVAVRAGSALPEVVGAAGAAGHGPDGLADAVVELLGRDEDARRRAARARAEQFPWSATVERMTALHAGLAAGRTC